NPERLPIIETSDAIDMLDQYHLHVKTLIVNRVLPENDEGQFFKQRKDHEAMYLEEIKTTFKNQDLIYVPFLHMILLQENNLKNLVRIYKEGMNHNESLHNRIRPI